MTAAAEVARLTGMAKPTDAPRPFAWIFHSDDRSLDRAREEMFEMLAVGASKASHGFHLPVVATFDAADGRPSCRTVVLRHFDAGGPLVQCHTDARSPKVAEVRGTPAASWTFYDRESRVQVVAEGAASVHTNDAVADAAWDRSRTESLRCYLAPKTPGERVSLPDPNLPEDLIGKVPSEERAAEGRGNFAVVRTLVTRFDLLILKSTGNVRAEFVREGGGWSQSWIAA